MGKKNAMKKKLGVIVGRFQIADLHDGHKHLINTVLSEADKVLVLVGVHNGQPTDRDPLDFSTRADMILDRYSNVEIHPISDHPSDAVWSRELDKLLESLYDNFDPIMYGSRDSFINVYSGKHTAREISPIESLSGTESRASSVAHTNDIMFRSGVIHASVKQRQPISYQVVDVAILHTTKKEVLLGKRDREEGWRFFGGIVDPKYTSLEQAAKHEAREDVGDVRLDDFVYLGSTQISDRSYNNSQDALMSIFFTAKYVSGTVSPADDIDEIRWFAYEEVEKNLAGSHKQLGEMFTRYINTK